MYISTQRVSFIVKFNLRVRCKIGSHVSKVVATDIVR